MAGISTMRSDADEDVKPARLTIVAKGERYELDLNTLDYHEKKLARSLMSGDIGTLAGELLGGNEEAPYVAAYLAIVRTKPKMTFDEVAKLTAYTLDVVIEPVEDDVPLDDDSETSSSPADPAPTKPKRSSGTASTAAK